MENPGRMLLPCSSAALGFFSCLAQVVILRELFVLFYGSELNIGLVLAGWLFWTGAGSLAGSRLPTTWFRGPALSRLLLASSTAAALLLPLTILIIRSLPLWAFESGGEFLSFQATILVTCALLSAIGLSCGIWFSLSCALAEESNTGAGRAYAWEAAGGLAGGGSSPTSSPTVSRGCSWAWPRHSSLRPSALPSSPEIGRGALPPARFSPRRSPCSSWPTPPPSSSHGARPGAGPVSSSSIPATPAMATSHC